MVKREKDDTAFYKDMGIEKILFRRRWFLVLILSFAVFLNCTTGEDVQHDFQTIEVLIDAPQGALRSFRIDSRGRVAEMIEKEDGISVFEFYLNQEELDSVNNSINGFHDFKYIDDPDSGCSHGLFYDMSIEVKGERSYDFFNLICEKPQKPDVLIFYLLETAELKKKDTLFKKYEEHAETRLKVDSILKVSKTR